VKLIESALYTLKKYADFSGRASREEFWLFVVFVVIAQAVAGFVGLFWTCGGRCQEWSACC
jgi:uncharacterized membrane protein YhaH (DUF805 family)